MKESANFFVRWPLRGGIFSMTCCAMVTRGLHADGLTQSAHLHNHQIGISLSMLQPNKTNISRTNATVPMTRDFYHLLPVVAACLLCPFFIANETREMTFTKVKDSRSCLTQWDYEYLYEFSIHRCTFL